MSKTTLRHLQVLYSQPLFSLIQQARTVHIAHWPPYEIQLSTLLSIKTGGCSEDCSYCAQSARHPNRIPPEKMMKPQDMVAAARQARDAGANRFCMGAAWKGIGEHDEKFQTVLDVVRQVSQLGLEVCVTLGQISESTARKLKQAGASVYNHNLDTSPEFYPQIVTTHSFEDRLATIRAVQTAGLAVCCGGIIGMGESVTDRLRMIEVLAAFDPPPESVPINCLVPMPGTPLENQPPVDVFDLVRLVATTRITLPRSRVRLSAGRLQLSREAQALCFFAGANSIFFGGKLLTTGNPGTDSDLSLLSALDLKPQPPRPS